MGYEIPMSPGGEVSQFIRTLREQMIVEADRMETTLALPLPPGTAPTMVTVTRRLHEKKPLTQAEKEVVTLCVERVVDAYESDVRERERKKVERGEILRPNQSFSLTGTERTQLKNFIVYVIATHAKELQSGKYTEILNKIYDSRGLPEYSTPKG